MKFLWVVFCLLSSVVSGADLKEVLRKADEVRNPSDSFRMKVEIESPGNPKSVFEVALKGADKTLVRTLEPARDKGRNLLMLGEKMWAYVPNLKRAIRVSLNQKLTGQAANGDISRMRWAEDYEPTLESESASTWTLLLTAQKKGLTYEKIRVQIDKKNYRPSTAEYLTQAGKKLKLAEFSNYQKLAGGMRPSQIKIQDATQSSQVSVLKILSMENAVLAEALFNQSSLQN